MKVRSCLIALVASFFAAVIPGHVLAAEAARQFSLLILDSQMGNPYDEVRASMLRSLEGYGYEQGKNLKVTVRASDNDARKGVAILSAELKRRHYDVVFVGGTVATIAARNALLGDKKQKVVFGSPTDPVGIGVIKDFSSPPFANFTGVCYPVPPASRLKFIKTLLPNVKTLGLIYADMPQSRSYNSWLADLLSEDPEFKGIKILFRAVPLVTGEQGDKQMAASAIPIIKELDAKVDAFIKPNDQMGTRRPFAEVVYKHASKPLIGITRGDVMGHWGATAVVYPSHASIGEQAAAMVKDLFEGKSISEIRPEWPKKFGFAVDLRKAKRYNISVPIELLQLSGENIVK